MYTFNDSYADFEGFVRKIYRLTIVNSLFVLSEQSMKVHCIRTTCDVHNASDSTVQLRFGQFVYTCGLKFTVQFQNYTDSFKSWGGINGSFYSFM